MNEGCKFCGSPMVCGKICSRWHGVWMVAGYALGLLTAAVYYGG